MPSSPALAAPPLRAAALLGLALAAAGAAGAVWLAGLAGVRADLAAGGAALVALAGLALVLRALAAGAYPHARLGPGNVLTLTRGGGVAALAGLALAAGGAWTDAAGWAVAALSAVLVALDGLDGRAARVSGTSSAFGARLDVETDLALMAVLAVLAWQSGQSGAWVLALPLFRPAYLLAGRIWPILAAPLPPRPRRSRVAGVQYAGQVLILAPALPPALAGAVAAGLVAMVALSFLVDLVWLTRQRAAP